LDDDKPRALKGRQGNEAEPSRYNDAMKRNKFPPGWDEERVRRVLEHYEKQTEDEAVAEDEAALRLQVGSDLDLDEDLELTGIEAPKKSDDE
jgi:hypothetical protein